MSKVRLNLRRGLFILVFASIAVFGTITVINRTEYGIETEQLGGEVCISQVKAGSGAESAGILPGDKLKAIDGTAIINRAQARWLKEGVGLKSPASFKIDRNGTEHEAEVLANRPFNAVFVFIMTLLGITFLTVGLMVWWIGSRDPTVKSFFRITSFAGISILLFSHENSLRPVLFHYLYTFLWLLTYCLTPPALMEFLIRFRTPADSLTKNKLRIWLIYIPVCAAFFILGYSYFRAYSTFNVNWITIYENIFRYLFNSLLIIYFVVSLFLILERYIRPRKLAERDRNRWLILCTFAGSSPFFFLYKLPEIFGLSPLMPIWAVFGFMLIVPVGWGMAMASFRMLNLEWALSRSMIYIITAILIIILFVYLILSNLKYFDRGDKTSLVTLMAISLLFVYLAGSGLISQVQKLIDRMYYRDWFNYRQAFMSLGDELSKSITESDIVHTLTVKLPDILKIERAVFLIRESEGQWREPLQTTKTSGKEIAIIRQILQRQTISSIIQLDKDLHKINLAKLKVLGYQVMLPLIHSGEVVGILLLGTKVSEAPFSSRDYQLLDSIANHAGTSIANLNLTRKVLEQEKRALAVDMAGGIAHEINNALAPLMGQAQLMEMTLNAQNQPISVDKQKSSLSIIVEMCQRIKKIVLNLSKISEPLHLEKAPVSLNKIAEETIVLMSETAGRIKYYKADNPEANFKLQREFDSQLPTTIGDAQQLSQVFINLIINASDAMEAIGKGTLTVGTRYDREQTSVVGFVEDTGTGIPKGIIDKVLQPYFTTKPKGKGTGLGMAIVRSIIESHNGHLHISSTEGVGTRIEFSLPIAQNPDVK